VTLLRVMGGFVRRDWAEARSYRAAVVLGVLDVALRLTTFFFIAELVDGTDVAGDDLEGGYFTFVVIGLALAEVLGTGLATVSGKLREEQYTGTLELVMAAPVRLRHVLAGLSAFEFLRALAGAALMVTVAAAVFGLETAPLGTAYLALVPAVLGAVTLFVAVGILVAAATLVIKQTRALLGLVTEAIAIAGGVYFPLSVLPGPLETAAGLLPFTWAVEVARGIVIGGEVRGPELIGLLVAAGLALPLAALVFGRAAARARREGSMVEY
jgi:ABC-2 type transport system permease protein